MNTLVVADVYKLSMFGNKFSNDIKTAKLERKKLPVDKEYAERMTENWESTGMKFVVDEEATKEFHAEMERRRIESQEIDEEIESAEKELDITKKTSRKPKRKTTKKS